MKTQMSLSSTLLVIAGTSARKVAEENSHSEAVAEAVEAYVRGRSSTLRAALCRAAGNPVRRSDLPWLRTYGGQRMLRMLGVAA